MDSSARFTSVATAYPEVMAVIVLVLGLVIAFAARSLTERGMVTINRLLARFTMERDGLLSDRVIAILVSLVFWLLLGLALALALRTLGTGRLFTWLDLPLSYLPRILVGLFIIGAGHILGVLARQLLARLRGARDRSNLLPRLTQAAILVIALMTGLQHMGLDVSFIGQLLILLVGAGIGGLALAFALGARRYVANLIAHSTAARYNPGDYIRIGDMEGTIIEIHRTGVDLVTNEGVVTVPAALFAEQPVLRRTPVSDQKT